MLGLANLFLVVFFFHLELLAPLSQLSIWPSMMLSPQTLFFRCVIYSLCEDDSPHIPPLETFPLPLQHSHDQSWSSPGRCLPESYLHWPSRLHDCVPPWQVPTWSGWLPHEALGCRDHRCFDRNSSGGPPCADVLSMVCFSRISLGLVCLLLERNKKK